MGLTLFILLFHISHEMEACRVDDGDGVGVGAHVLLPAVPPRRMMTGCRLAFHGAAANSRPHSLLWVRAPRIRIDDDDPAGGNGDIRLRRRGQPRVVAHVRRR